MTIITNNTTAVLLRLYKKTPMTSNMERAIDQTWKPDRRTTRTYRLIVTSNMEDALSIKPEILTGMRTVSSHGLPAWTKTTSSRLVAVAKKSLSIHSHPPPPTISYYNTGITSYQVHA